MKAKKVAFLGLSIALAMILSFVEHQIPALVSIPGIKIGLPNLVMVFLLYRVGWKETVIVSIVRILLVSMLFGGFNPVALAFSLMGAILSLACMILLKKTGWFSCITVSISGGIMHNVGQIIAAYWLTATPQIVYYLPVLLISGIVSGAIIGILAGMIVKRMERWKF